MTRQAHIARAFRHSRREVDGYLRKNKKWQAELARLREIVLASPLREEVKWRVPCYTFEGSNVILLGAFKRSCVFSFPKGALLNDPKGILVKPGENTRAARVIRFTDVADRRHGASRVDRCVERILKGKGLDDE
jgi:uncharacterized protein YdeI (YjbR/CyaY-like superfamily)